MKIFTSYLCCPLQSVHDKFNFPLLSSIFPFSRIHTRTHICCLHCVIAKHPNNSLSKLVSVFNTILPATTISPAIYWTFASSFFPSPSPACLLRSVCLLFFFTPLWFECCVWCVIREIRTTADDQLRSWSIVYYPRIHT